MGLIRRSPELLNLAPEHIAKKTNYIIPSDLPNVITIKALVNL